mmetsp:Transcript_2466/g.4188  ORF Transcript_2466/g.4188 Transcript_2466/m.4188 type:complete len:233 (-) Transcript_2466:30-728(-)
MLQGRPTLGSDSGTGSDCSTAILPKRTKSRSTSLGDATRTISASHSPGLRRAARQAAPSVYSTTSTYTSPRMEETPYGIIPTDDPSRMTVIMWRESSSMVQRMEVASPFMLRRTISIHCHRNMRSSPPAALEAKPTRLILPKTCSGRTRQFNDRAMEAEAPTTQPKSSSSFVPQLAVSLFFALALPVSDDTNKKVKRRRTTRQSIRRNTMIRRPENLRSQNCEEVGRGRWVR